MRRNLWSPLPTVIRERRAPPKRRALWRVVMVLFACVVAGAAVFGVMNARALYAALSAISHPASAAERTRGIVRDMGRIVAATPTSFPPCLGWYKSGKSSKALVAHADSRVLLDDGRTLLLPAAANVEFFLKEEPRGTDARAVAAARARMRGMKSDVSFGTITCLGPTEKVWVEGCLKGDDTLIGCAAQDDEVILTVGGPSARETWVRSHAFGSVALTLLGAVILLSFAWMIASRPRTAIPTLAATAGVTGFPGAANVALALCGLATFVTLCTWWTSYGPFVFAIVVTTLAVLTLYALVARRRVLAAASRVAKRTNTSTLSEAGGAHQRRPRRRARSARREERRLATDNDDDQLARSGACEGLSHLRAAKPTPRAAAASSG